MQLMKFHQAPEKRLLSWAGDAAAAAAPSVSPMYLYLCRNQNPQLSVFLSDRLMFGDYLLRRVIRRRIDDKQTSTRNVSSSYHRLMRIASPIHQFDPPFFGGPLHIFGTETEALCLFWNFQRVG